MALFKVTDIKEGDLLQVDGWSWSGHSGNLVKVNGLKFPDQSYKAFAKGKLQALLLNKSVELKKVMKAEKGIGEGNDTIFCSVYLNDINISEYFPELSIN